MRRITSHGADKLLWLKMRTDTPQHYEYITVEDVEGFIGRFVFVRPWTQFFDMKGRTEVPRSKADHITIQDCKCKCNDFFDVEEAREQYELTQFTFENLDIEARNGEFNTDVIDDFVIKNVKLC